MANIKCVDLCKIYRQGDAEVRALDHVSLEIEQASFICLSGPSGSGKTTLLNAIGGLDELDSGQISIDGDRVDLLGKGPLADLRLHHIGFVFQAYNLIPVLSARENVEFIMQLQGVRAAERRTRAIDMLTALGIGELAERRPGELSGGQQQRVAVARAIVTHPVLLLADEPSANLDSHTTAELLELLKLINEEHGMTIITATHDPAVMAYARRRIHLQDGLIVSDERVDAAAA